MTFELNTLDLQAMETKIRRDNLRRAFQNWSALTSEEFGQLIKACKLEWGEGWLGEVLRRG